MRCDNCGEREAVIHLTQIVDNTVTTLHLCEQCAAHLAYGEKRRAFCPKDPKPFCANCDVHCYRNEEREWQRQMMRYSGPRSVLHGHAIDGIRHVLETRRHRRAADNE